MLKNISCSETNILCNDIVCISFNYDKACFVTVTTNIKHILPRNHSFLDNWKFGISELNFENKNASDALQGSADPQKASRRLSAVVFEVWEVKILTEKPSLGAWKTLLGTLVIASGVEATPLGAGETPLGGTEI